MPPDIIDRLDDWNDLRKIKKTVQKLQERIQDYKNETDPIKKEKIAGKGIYGYNKNSIIHYAAYLNKTAVAISRQSTLNKKEFESLVLICDVFDSIAKDTEQNESYFSIVTDIQTVKERVREGFNAIEKKSTKKDLLEVEKKVRGNKVRNETKEEIRKIATNDMHILTPPLAFPKTELGKPQRRPLLELPQGPDITIKQEQREKLFHSIFQGANVEKSQAIYETCDPQAWEMIAGLANRDISADNTKTITDLLPNLTKDPKASKDFLSALYHSGIQTNTNSENSEITHFSDDFKLHLYQQMDEFSRQRAAQALGALQSGNTVAYNSIIQDIQLLATAEVLLAGDAAASKKAMDDLKKETDSKKTEQLEIEWMVRALELEGMWDAIDMINKLDTIDQKKEVLKDFWGYYKGIRDIGVTYRNQISPELRETVLRLMVDVKKNPELVLLVQDPESDPDEIPIVTKPIKASELLKQHTDALEKLKNGFKQMENQYQKDIKDLTKMEQYEYYINDCKQYLGNEKCYMIPQIYEQLQDKKSIQDQPPLNNIMTGSMYGIPAREQGPTFNQKKFEDLFQIAKENNLGMHRMLEQNRIIQLEISIYEYEQLLLQRPTQQQKDDFFLLKAHQLHPADFAPGGNIEEATHRARIRSNFGHDMVSFVRDSIDHSISGIQDLSPKGGLKINDLMGGDSRGMKYFKNLAKQDPHQFTQEALLRRSDWINSYQGDSAFQGMFTQKGGIFESLLTYKDVCSTQQKKEGFKTGKDIIESQMGKYGITLEQLQVRSLESNNAIAGNILGSSQDDIMKIALLLKNYNNDDTSDTKEQIKDLAIKVQKNIQDNTLAIKEQLKKSFLPESRFDGILKLIDEFVDFIKSGKFKDGDITQWIKAEGLPTLCAIAGGVGLAMITGGGSIIGMAFRGAVGGELGSGTGIVANNAIHHSIGSDYHQNTIVGNLLSDNNYDISDALTTESQRIVMGTATSAAFMGLGRGISLVKANHLNTGSLGYKAIAGMESINQYLSTALPEQVAKRMGHVAGQLMEEYRQEMMGMAIEKGTKDTDYAWIGNVANVLFSMNKQQVNISNCDVSTSGISETRDEATGQRVINTAMVINQSDPTTMDLMTRFFVENGVKEEIHLDTDAKAGKKTTLSYDQEVEMTQKDGSKKKETVKYTYTLEYGTINSQLQALCSNNNFPTPNFVDTKNGIETCSFVDGNGKALINPGQMELLLAGLGSAYSIVDNGDNSYELVLGRQHIIVQFPSFSNNVQTANEQGELTRLQNMQITANNDRDPQKKKEIETNSDLSPNIKLAKLQAQFPNESFLRPGYVILPTFTTQQEQEAFYKSNTQQVVTLEGIQQAIDEAHESGGVLFNLSFGDLRMRYELLSNMGLTREAIGFLLEGGYCGHTSLSLKVYNSIEQGVAKEAFDVNPENQARLINTLDDFKEMLYVCDFEPNPVEQGYIIQLFVHQFKRTGRFDFDITTANAIIEQFDDDANFKKRGSLSYILKWYTVKQASRNNKERLHRANAPDQQKQVVAELGSGMQLMELFSRTDLENTGEEMANCLNDFSVDGFNNYHNRIKQGSARLFTIEQTRSNGQVVTRGVIELVPSPYNNGWTIKEMRTYDNAKFTAPIRENIQPALTYFFDSKNNFNINGINDASFIWGKITTDPNLAPHLKNITQLSLETYPRDRNYSTISSDDIENISTICPNITNLSLKNCKVTNSSLKALAKLQKLKLEECTVDDPNSRKEIFRNTHLAQLERKVDNPSASQPSSPFLYATNLGQIHLSGTARHANNLPITGLYQPTLLTLNNRPVQLPPLEIPVLTPEKLAEYISKQVALGYDFFDLIPATGAIRDPQRKAVVETILGIQETNPERNLRYQIFEAMITPPAKLTDAQKAVIKSTHDKNPDKSTKTIKQKFDLLTTSELFTPQQVRMLLKWGICGTEKVEIGTKWRSDGSFSKVTNHFEDAINVEVIGETFVKTYKSAIHKLNIDAYYEIQSKFRKFVESSQKNDLGSYPIKVVESPISIEKYKNYTVVSLPLVSGTTLDEPVKQGDSVSTGVLDKINTLWKTFIKHEYNINDISSISPQCCPTRLTKERIWRMCLES